MLNGCFVGVWFRICKNKTTMMQRDLMQPARERTRLAYYLLGKREEDEQIAIAT